MIFASTEFLFVFLPIFIFIYFLMPGRSLKNTALFCFSVIFYAWGEPVYVFLILISMLANYILGLLIGNTKSRIYKKLLLSSAIFFNIAVIGYFKYTNFIIDNINSLTGLNISERNIALPIGISFFTFQIITYVIDVYRGDAVVQKNPIYLGSYIFAFPQLIAGPIVRYQTVAEEIMSRKTSIEDFSYGLRRFMTGFSKKVLIANNMGTVVDAILNHSPETYGMLGGWIAAVGYTLQIYFDFSGYSDMAIGLGRMLGFHYLENFNYPYISKSVTEFWRRWHISLSTFFRDYVYIPMGGNRVSSVRWILNIFTVWFLTGLWHGASWNFVVWGLYYGILLLFEKLVLGRINIAVPATLKHLYAIFCIVIGWILFRQENLSMIPKMLCGLFGGYGIGNVDFLVYVQVIRVKYIVAFAVGIAASVPIIPFLSSKLSDSPLGSFAKIAGDLLLISAFLLSIGFILLGSYNPFIYFKF